MLAGIWALAVALVRPADHHVPADVLRDPAAGPGLQHARHRVRDADGDAGAAHLRRRRARRSRPRGRSTCSPCRSWATASAPRRGSSSPRHGSIRARPCCPSTRSTPRGRRTEQRNEESAAMMVDSQKEATAAALTELGYDVDAELTVHSFTEDSAAEGVLEEGDVILAANGEAVADAAELCARSSTTARATRSSCRSSATARRRRSRSPRRRPRSTARTTWLIGVTLMHDYEFPIDVTIQLNNVGGPSAGMMFALGHHRHADPGRAERRRDRRRHRHDRRRRRGRPDRRHPSEDVGRRGRRRRMVPGARGELR